MFKSFFFVLWTMLFFSCNHVQENRQQEQVSYKSTFDSILNNYNLQGSILIYDPQQKMYFSNDFNWAKTGFLPASTFKIPNAIIALETMRIKSDSSLIKWDGKKRLFPSWEKDLTLREAFQVSCVPCFQEIARKIGLKDMTDYLQKLHYPSMSVSEATLDNFWLTGASRITQMEQISFLQRFYTKKLPILTTTREMMLRVLEIEKKNDYIFSGKTGWSVNEKDNNGWFVGFIEKGEKIYYFALNVIPQDDEHIENFASGRVNAMRDALQAMQILPKS